jgi:predicted ATPase
MRGDLVRAAQNEVELARLAREHDLPMYRAFGVFFQGLATAQSGARGDGLEGVRHGAELLREQNVVFDGLWKIALAEAEARAGDIDRALAILDEALATSERTGYRAFEAELHRVRGDMLLKRDPANPVTAAEAFQTAIAVAKQQGTRSFELRAALVLAKLYHSIARPADAHAVLAPALEGFSPTPEMLQIAEAQELLAALAETDEVKNAAASRQRRLQLQTRYGQAMMYSRGFGSDESKTAFAHARTLAAGVGDASERFDAYYGLFVSSLLRGELRLARETAESFLGEAENEARMTEAAVAHRNVGAARLHQGDFIDAEANFAAALRTYDPERDRDTKFRFGVDTGAGAAGFLALAIWPLGDVERARALSEEALARADDIGHAPTRAFVYYQTSLYQTLRSDPEAVRRIGTIVVDLSREHGMGQWLALGEVQSSWARARLGDRETEITELRRALAAYFDTGNKLFAPLFRGQLAELEAEGNDADGALRRINEALALTSETGEHWTDALLHRIRGAILLKRDPANMAAAEEAFLAAIAVAQAQKARSFKLQAALALARLYQATGRPADAHAVLTPALEGFAPTPEMPEIAEAQALLAALAETDEVKAAIAQRERRLHLQTAYGQAMMLSRGFGSAESKTAFARARSLAAGVGGASERFEAYYGLFVGSLLRGELSSARETAESFLRDAEDEGWMTEASVARRNVGTARLYQGDFIDAEVNLAEALKTYDPERDRDAKFRFGWDCGAGAAAYLTHTSWALGDVERARALSEEALARADETVHAPTRAIVYHTICLYQMLRGDPEAVRRIAKTPVELGREHGMALYVTYGEVHSNWARTRLGDREGGTTALRGALTAYLGQGNKLWVPLFQGLLAELEAEGNDADAALRRIDEALALANETGEHWTDAKLHRIRAEILLKRNPANPAPAEEAFQTAIAIAQAQKARSFQRQAALALAKLYQSTGRPAEAHAVLEPALEGFSPTPELPEIAEAQALLESLA